MSGSDGAFSGMLGSIQSHFEDRLKSPFAGAFLVAWGATNWKPILILAASAAPIEARIDSVSATYFSSAWTYLWLPLVYAVVGVLSYYALSTLFAFFHELHGILKRFVERKFDSYRWVHPDTYIEAKRENRNKIEYLSSLATDQLEAIEKLRTELAVAQGECAAMQEKVEEGGRNVAAAKGLVEIQASVNVAQEEEITKLREDLEDGAGRYSRLVEAASQLQSAAKIVANQLETFLGPNDKIPIPMIDYRKRRPLELLITANTNLSEALNELG